MSSTDSKSAESQAEVPSAIMLAIAKQWLRANDLSLDYADALGAEMARACRIGHSLARIQTMHERMTSGISGIISESALGNVEVDGERLLAKTSAWSDEERREMAERRERDAIEAGAYEMGPDGKPLRVNLDTTAATPTPGQAASAVAEKDWPAKARVALDLVNFYDDEAGKLSVIEKCLRWAAGLSRPEGLPTSDSSGTAPMQCFHNAKGKPCTRYLEGSVGEREAIKAWLRSPAAHLVVMNADGKATSKFVCEALAAALDARDNAVRAEPAPGHYDEAYSWLDNEFGYQGSHYGDRPRKLARVFDRIRERAVEACIAKVGHFADNTGEAARDVLQALPGSGSAPATNEKGNDT